MGDQMSICSAKSQTVAEDDTFQYTGSRFIIPNKIDFSTQNTFTRIERTAKDFCRMNKINDFYFPLISRMIAYKHEKLFQAAWARIISDQRIRFLDSLIDIPHELMDSFYHHYFQKVRVLKKSIKNILMYSPRELLVESPKGIDAEQLKNLGRKILLNNKVAVFFMCAGYSSRFEKEDKFLATIDSFGKVNILDLLFLRLRRNGASKQINIIINCNEANINIIRRYVSKKGHFGFDGNNIKFLLNFSLPIFDQNGQYCLDENNKIVKRSSGTANAVQQILLNNLYGLLQKKGVQYAFISGAENMMENPCDPVFMGKMLQMERNVAIKCVNPIFERQNLARIGLDSSHNLRIINGDVLNQLSYNVRSNLPIPINSIFFNLETLKKAARDYSVLYSMAQNYQVIQIQQKILNYQTNQVTLNTCFNFQKDIRCIITCIRDPLLYKSNRIEEYVPIITKNKQYSLVSAQQYLKHKIQQQIYQLNI